MSLNLLDDEIWVINFVSFNTFLVIFQPKWFAYTLLLRFNTLELKENLTERELMPFLVWNNSSVCSDNTQTLATSGSEKIQRYYKNISM